MTQKKLYFFIFLVLSLISFGQQTDKEKLQRQNADLKKQIQLLNANLQKTQVQSRLSVSYLQGLNQKIGLREKLYSNTQREKRFIDDDIYLRQLEINKLQRELQTLRDNYASILVKAYKNKGIQNKIIFILSSKNLGEAIRRVQYLKQYSDFQDKKAAEITGKSNEVKASIGKREASKREKENLLLNQQRDLTKINNERDQRQALLADFKLNEAKLTAQIKQKQAQQKKLESEIRRVINAEIAATRAKAAAEAKAEAERVRLAKIAAEKEKARIDAENKAQAAALEKARKDAEAEARKAADIAAKRAADEKKRTAQAAADAANARAAERKEAAEKAAADAAEKARAAEARAVAARAAEARLDAIKAREKKAAEDNAMKTFGAGSASGSSFAANRGRMPSPVSRGRTTHFFGRQPNPIYPGIVEDNSGITIAVPKGTIARSVFAGEVSKVLFNGDSRTVVVRHGTYFTVYSNLSTTSVSPGQNVSAGTPIGEVGLDIDGTYSLEFQIWNGSTPINPSGWIAQ